MREEKIDVACYSGYRLHEKPVKFIYKGDEHLVEKILDLSTEESMNGENRHYRFRILCRDKKVYSIFYDSNLEQWFLEK